MTGSTLTSTAKVPVGVTTLAGYGTSVVTLAGAVADYLSGDHSRDTLLVLLLGGYSALSFAITQVMRYVQAHAQVKASGKVLEARELSHMPYGTATPGVTAETPDGLPTATTRMVDEKFREGDWSSASEPNPLQALEMDPNPPEGPNPAAARDVLDRTER